MCPVDPETRCAKPPNPIGFCWGCSPISSSESDKESSSSSSSSSAFVVRSTIFVPLLLRSVLRTSSPLPDNEATIAKSGRTSRAYLSNLTIKNDDFVSIWRVWGMCVLPPAVEEMPERGARWSRAFERRVTSLPATMDFTTAPTASGLLVPVPFGTKAWIREANRAMYPLEPFPPLLPSGNIAPTQRSISADHSSFAPSSLVEADVNKAAARIDLASAAPVGGDGGCSCRS